MSCCGGEDDGAGWMDHNSTIMKLYGPKYAICMYWDQDENSRQVFSVKFESFWT